MNKTMQQPNGPGMTTADQAAFVNGRGSRLIGAPDSQTDYTFAATLNRVDRRINHRNRELANAFRLGKIIGTVSR